jgi:hypothetical protein
MSSRTTDFELALATLTGLYRASRKTLESEQFRGISLTARHSTLIRFTAKLGTDQGQTGLTPVSWRDERLGSGSLA